MLSRAIMAPRDLILDTIEAQRLALFFDHILVWGLSREKFSDEQNARFAAELEYLREEGLVATCGPAIPIPIQGLNEALGLNFDIALMPAGKLESIPDLPQAEATDRVVRFMASELGYKGAPVASHTPFHGLTGSRAHELNSLELVLNKVPLPPENIPWDDLLQFRKEDENKAKLRQLRLWLCKFASQNESNDLLVEELEQLLYDYEKYMKLMHSKYSNSALSVLLSCSKDVISLDLVGAADKLLSCRQHNAELVEKEMEAPGREVSYILSASKFGR